MKAQLVYHLMRPRFPSPLPTKIWFRRPSFLDHFERERWRRLRKLSRFPRAPIVGRLGLLTAALWLSPLVCGCQRLSYTSPTGEQFVRVAVGTKLAIGQLSVGTGTNGVRTIELRGYESDPNQALGTVTEAAIRAALQGAK